MAGEPTDAGAGAGADANAPPKPFSLSFAKVAPRPAVAVAGQAEPSVTRELIKGVEGERVWMEGGREGAMNTLFPRTAKLPHPQRGAPGSTFRP